MGRSLAPSPSALLLLPPAVSRVVQSGQSGFDEGPLLLFTQKNGKQVQLTTKLLPLPRQPRPPSQEEDLWAPEKSRRLAGEPRLGQRRGHDHVSSASLSPGRAAAQVYYQPLRRFSNSQPPKRINVDGPLQREVELPEPSSWEDIRRLDETAIAHDHQVPSGCPPQTPNGAGSMVGNSPRAGRAKLQMLAGGDSLPAALSMVPRPPPFERTRHVKKLGLSMCGPSWRTEITKEISGHKSAAAVYQSPVVPGLPAPNRQRSRRPRRQNGGTLPLPVPAALFMSLPRSDSELLVLPSSEFLSSQPRAEPPQQELSSADSGPSKIPHPPSDPRLGARNPRKASRALEASSALEVLQWPPRCAVPWHSSLVEVAPSTSSCEDGAAVQTLVPCDDISTAEVVANGTSLEDEVIEETAQQVLDRVWFFASETGGETTEELMDRMRKTLEMGLRDGSLEKVLAASQAKASETEMRTMMATRLEAALKDGSLEKVLLETKDAKLKDQADVVAELASDLLEQVVGNGIDMYLAAEDYGYSDDAESVCFMDVDDDDLDAYV